ncbi:MAG: ADP-glyceromanno-heptose 6-epimerase [Gammaproteobacteria bacterium]|nr:ADP-glyceromanno-heptose 6-epimerase [Gammaproteobacteria bacterium]
MPGSPVILITGGAGFIGSNLVAHFAERADVVVCDRLGHDDRWRNIADWDVADLVGADDLGDFLAGNAGRIDVVVHMGAISSTTERDVDLVMRTNFKLPQELWRWCARNDSRFIYASSAATYGDGAVGFDDDETALARLRPLNPYGWSKHLFDRWVQRSLATGQAHPAQWTGLKFFNVYGPNEEHKGSMRSVVRQVAPIAKAGEPVRLFRSHRPDVADGAQSRDFVTVADCVGVVDWLVRNASVNGLYNVGTGEARTFADLARAVFTALGREPRVEYIDIPAAIRERYQYFTQAEIGKLRRAGYERPFTTLEDGVAAYVRHLDCAGAL